MSVCFKEILAKVTDVSSYLNLGKVPRLMAVSKFHSVNKIQEAINQGASWFGESYLKELEEKYHYFKDRVEGIHWSFIGKLQSNKIARIVECADEIQSVENMKQISFISRYASIQGKIPYPIYIELNLESQKAGISYEKITELYKDILSSEFACSISVEGIMCVPPVYEENIKVEDLKKSIDNIKIPKLYQDIYEFSQTIGKKKLSLGMSSDMITAIIAGSSCLRVGTDIFGPRNYPDK